MSTRICILTLLCLAMFVVQATESFALPVNVVHMDTPACDPLFIPKDGVHEIGDSTIFPSDEALFSMDQGPSNFAPCPPTNDTAIPDPVVEMRNLSGRDWLEVWYVADRETTITNFDGEADDAAFAPLQEAFRIDNDIKDPGGIHHPLVFESMTPDGIWEAGESWRFILQDYSNLLGLPPSALDSLGVGSASGPSPAGVASSSGSIIGITVPEPASLGLLFIGCVGCCVARRS